MIPADTFISPFEGHFEGTKIEKSKAQPVTKKNCWLWIVMARDISCDLISVMENLDINYI